MKAQISNRKTRGSIGMGVSAICSARNLLANFAVIRASASGQELIPMIKAGAYGHGAAWAAKTLARAPGLFGFGVATLEEGREVRETLGARERKTRILVFSGTLPWSDEVGRRCERQGLTPVISSDLEWTQFLRGRWTRRLRYHLKFNTGMNRLGLSMEGIRAVAAQLTKLPPAEKREGVLSHLAMAEDPASELTKRQLSRFRALRAELESVAGNPLFHLAGSGGIWNLKALGLDSTTALVRPGISLYGVVPWSGAEARGIVPVMRVSARVAATREVAPGESVGYGGRFQVAEGGPPARIAILGGGYADGILRALSGRGMAILKGRKERFVGTISMDLSAISCGASARAGDQALVLGPGIDPWEQAQLAGTVPYQLLTSVSGRVERTYV